MKEFTRYKKFYHVFGFMHIDLYLGLMPETQEDFYLVLFMFASQLYFLCIRF